MADTELKKLNKNVEDAVNILKVYMGNSAQIKNMNEKQRQAIEKWFDVTEQQEDQVKQQRAFTERARDEHGRFIKKQEAMSFNFLGIANAISGIFMGMAKGIGSAIGNIAKGVTSHLRNFFSAVKSHFLGLFGEESEWFDILAGIKDAVTGFFGWFARGFVWVFKKTPSWASKMVKTLQNMYALQVKQMKMGMLDGEQKKKLNFWGILGAALFLGAALIGGWIRKKLMGIELILRAFKFGKIWDAIKLRFFGIMSKIRGRFGWIDDILKSRAFIWLQKGFIKFKDVMTKFGKWLMKAPILGKILRGLKFGFKVLGWPITILFGIIDFIKGWMNTEGDWRDKLAGGLKAAIHGILDLPLEILGWAWDKLMGLFGIESSGTGDKLKQWFDDLMGFIFEWGPIGIISDLIKGFTTGDMAGAFSDKIEKIKNIFGTILDLVANVWNSFLEWAIQKAEGIPWVGGKVAEWADNMKLDTPKRPIPVEKDVLDKAQKVEQKKNENQKDQADNLQKAVEEQTEATKANNRQTDGAVQAMTALSQNNAGGGSVEQKQIPDEIDNYVMAVKAYGGDFD